jgi:ankyrin repeat protein
MQGEADVNIQDNDGWTPLHAAVSAGNWRICNFLLTNGAKIDTMNYEGDVPLDLVDDKKVGHFQKSRLSTSCLRNLLHI